MNYQIDLTGLLTSTPAFGPCYCSPNLITSPVFSFAPGDTVDFGKVTLFMFSAGVTPDASGTNMNVDFVMSDVATAHFYPLSAYLYSNVFNYTFVSCAPFDAACLTSAINTSTTFDLLYTIPNNASIFQVGWQSGSYYVQIGLGDHMGGGYLYTPPDPVAAPIPSSIILFIAGLVLVRGMKAFMRGYYAI